MRELEIEVTNKEGNLVRATLFTPETVEEMVAVMGKRFVVDTMTRVYVQREKRRLISGWKPREKVLRFKESELTPEQKNALVGAGLISLE